jgi:hypothetical protein
MERADAFKERPRIIDAYCSVGKWRRPVNADLYGHDAASLLHEMDQKGIAEAVAHHSIARLSHPIDGNEQAMRMIEGQPRLHACWALLSKASREYDSFEKYIADAVQRGVRCFAVFPRFVVSPAGLDTSVREHVRAGTFRVLEERRLPLFVDFGVNAAGGQDDTDWEALRFLLSAQPELPVILSEFRLRGGSRLFPGVMDDHPNLRLETSGLWDYMSIEQVVEHWGAERLIFGTRSPWHSAGLALGMVTMSNVPAAQRAMILGGNIRRLMEAAR